MVNVDIQLAAGTNVGLVRKNNEDNFVVNSDLHENSWILPQHTDTIKLGSYGCLLVVADGMGGANAGEVASAIAIETIQNKFSVENLETIFKQGEQISEKLIYKFMQEAIKEADLNILHKAKEDSSTQGMGTTIVLLWILNERAHVAWCGDSRCYVFNEKAGLTRLSKDHSYVQELIDEGKLTLENAFDHPYSNIITRCLGDSASRAEPELRSYTYQPNDLFILCTDGLCGLCRDEEIMDIILKFNDSIQSCRDGLIQGALEAGGHDNVTIALCKINQEEIESEPEATLTDTIQLYPKQHSNKKKIFGWILFFIVCIVLGFMFKEQLISLWNSEVVSNDSIQTPEVTLPRN